MNRQLLEILSPVFNDISVQQGMEAYVKYRLEQLHIDIEREENPARIARIQGSITEVKELLKIRQRINDKVRELKA